MLKFIPLVSLIAIFGASLVRGEAIRRKTGDRAWAFASATGRQSMAGMAFALSTVILAVASGFAVIDERGIFPVVAAALSITGAVIVIIAQIQMGQAWRVGVRHGDAPLFVRHGLFRFSRNPIFVGMILIGLGVALLAHLWWVWVAWLVFVLACRTQVGIEEEHLATNFGDSYRDFCKLVPRWILF